ncbi:hypothetical protein GCM10009835_51210 [Planosporangium flavigriseum]|uniref:HTH cro/C1-type domain-containing protein n=1 Tax=Planosporangium flavigriseum TaxID=373681 RepID=A0A8J3LUB2_9ACTN|nr:hypothetical protein Pfl04_50820 [Planosporangium flavigriseum]
MVASGDRFTEPQPQAATPIEAPQCLADELRRRRLERGWSLRRAANEMRISSSSLLDYEKGRRIPAEDLIGVFERTLELPVDALQRLRREALIERAQAKTPAAAAPETSPPETSPRRQGVFADRPPWRRLAEAILCALIGAAVTLAVQALFHKRQGTVAAPSVSYSALPTRQVADDQDPHETGCDRDGTTIGVSDVVVAQPYRLVVAQVVARYSPSCAAIWMRFEPTRALDRLAPNARVTLLAERPADHRGVTFSGDYVGVPLWSNMLLARPGCVIGTLQLSDPAVAPGAAASTSCLSGPSPTPSRPR